MLPFVSAEGGLVKTPELAFSNAGKPWVRARIACKERQRGQSGEWQDGPATFIDVVCFGRTAENLVESADTGDTIQVVGRLQMNEWEGDDGVKRTSYRIVADMIGVSLAFTPAPTQRVRGTTSEPVKRTPPPTPADDLPFPF
jgi:single-strand DNA-binding protein